MALTDDLFQSIDTIVSARLANLPYDQTIECEIVAKDSTINKYTVLYQNAKFDAFPLSNETYEIGDMVYIKVPQGDFKENKFIIRKKQEEEGKTIKGLPFLNFLKSNNLANNITSKEFSLTLNNRLTQRQKVYEKLATTNNPIGGYTRLGIKMSLFSDITETLVSGDYGILIRVTGYDQTNTYLSAQKALTSNLIEKEFFLKTEDFIGANPYNTFGYCNQEKVFDITDFIIKSIEVFLWHDNNFKTNLTRLSEKTVRFKNIQLYLGYDSTEYPSISHPYIKLYTIDGLQYNQQALQKRLIVRCIQRYDANNFREISEYFNSASMANIYDYIWEQYDIYSTNTSTVSNLESYEEMKIKQEDVGKDQIVADLPKARNRISAKFVFTLQGKSGQSLTKITSNELQFVNSNYLENSEVIDIVLGLSASARESDADDDYDGKYFIYGQDSRATNNIITAKQHNINVTYTSISEDANKIGFQKDDVISWRIPIKNSMIIPAGTNYLKDNDEYYVFSSTIESDNTESFKIPYYINNYYTPSACNNTIEITMTRGPSTFNTSCDLSFGTSGSQGSEYSLRIKLEQTITDEEGNEFTQPIYTIPINNKNGIKVVVEVYDYDNKTIPLNDTRVTWDLITNGKPSNITISNDENNNEKGIINFSSIDFDTVYKNPVVVHVSIERSSIILESYYPLAFCTGNTPINANGNTLLTYDITGKKPLFIKTSFQLDKDYSNLKWNIEYHGNLNTDPNYNWKPILTDKNELAGSSMYVANSNKVAYSLVAKNNNEIIWFSPIYMFQHKYPNASYYPELNQLRFQYDNMNTYSIVNTLAGRVSELTEQYNNYSKENINGIFLGTVKTNNIEKLGLYAFHDNTNFVEINEDGYVFLNGRTKDGSETSGINIQYAHLSHCLIDGDSNINQAAHATTADNAVQAGRATTANNAIQAGKATTADNAVLAGKATNDSDGNKINTTYLKINGGTLTGALHWTNDSLSQFSSNPPYLLGIESFANGGTTKWKAVGNISVGSAASATYAVTAKNYDTSSGNIKTAIDDLQRQINNLRNAIEALQP